MSDSLSSLSKNLDQETTEALNATIQEILRSFQKFHESTTGSLLSEHTQRQRKSLLTMCVLAYLITWAGVVPTKISWLGIELTNANLAVIYGGLAIVLSYLFRAFWWRADIEFSNSRLRRQTASLLHQSEVNIAINSLRKTNKKLAKQVSDEFAHFVFSDDKDDPYRASLLGLNFKARFFELRLPHIVFVGALVSCLYFMHININV